MKKDQSTEDGEKNDKISPGCFMQKKADFNGLAARFHISPITARIIRNRDITDIKEFDKYLNGSLKDTYDPRLLPDMEKAVSILKEKIGSGARIRIVGDYDIDGVCSTCILYKGAEPGRSES